MEESLVWVSWAHSHGGSCVSVSGLWLSCLSLAPAPIRVGAQQWSHTEPWAAPAAPRTHTTGSLAQENSEKWSLVADRTGCTCQALGTMDRCADQRCLHRDGPFYLIVPLFYHTCSSPNHPDPSLPHCGSFPEHPIVSVVQSPCPAPRVSHTPAVPKARGLTHLSLGWAGGSRDGPGSSWTGFYLVPPPAMDSLFSFVVHT